MFPTGDDLPLFSQVAPRAEVDPFKAAPPAPKQLSLFEMQPTKPQKKEVKR